MQEVNIVRKKKIVTNADYALDFEGANGSKNFINTGKKTIGTTLVNGGPLISTAAKVNGTGSGSFGNISGDCLALNTAAAVWTGDFTISAWLNQNGPGTPLWSSNFQMIVSLNRVLADLVYCFCLHESKVAFKTVAANGALGTIIAGTTLVKSNIWEHVAMTRKDGILTLWLNGKPEATSATPWTNPLSSSTAFYVGNCYDGRTGGTGGYCGMNGYIDMFRIYGECLYTEPFIPSID